MINEYMIKQGKKISIKAFVQLFCILFLIGLVGTNIAVGAPECLNTYETKPDFLFFSEMSRLLVADTMKTTGKAHKKTVSLVSARVQSRMAHAVFESLSDEEKDIYKRGRNAKPKTMSKNADTAEYLSATGLEALFGWLYLRGDRDRLESLFEMCMKALETENENS